MLRRRTKPILLLTAVAVVLLLTVSRHGKAPSPLTTPTSFAATSKNYDLSALRVFNLSLHRIKENYVDSTRLEPRRMLLAALDYVQRGVAEVMVDARDDGRFITVSVDDAHAEFDLSSVDSPWTLSSKLKDVLRFVQKHVHPSTDLRDIEYDAVSGVLSTLDPHSQLLKPDIYNEMKLQTRGEFGGLGIVIGVRKGRLTVIKPIENTPAWRAGLKSGDRIVKINEESTVNLTLTEAVNRLRGAPGTKVVVWTERPPAATAKKHLLVRDLIEIQSVKFRLLKGNVGYVAIENFQGNTEDHLIDALTKLQQSGARSFIVDLRGNPGGLLDQAVKVADVFVEHGTIVTTLGMGGKQRDPKRAESDGDEFEHVPLAVMVNEGSASASEIVAGALRQLDRAVVIGRQTFGKGTVQVLYDNDDGSALKLTIAQYLTPGDVSIQQVGVTPDIVLQPVWISKDKPVHLYAQARRAMREEDLEEGVPLQHEGVRSTDRPWHTVHFVEKPPKWWGVEEEEEDPEETNEPEPELEPGDDPETNFVRDFLAEAKTGRRSELLKDGQAFLAKRLAQEDAQIEAAFSPLGIQWAASPAGSAAPSLVASTSAQAKPVEAGQRVVFRIAVHNTGTSDVHRVYIVSRSVNGLFDEREMPVGHLKPAEEKVVELAVRVPRDSYSRVDPVKFEIFADKTAVTSTETHVETRGVARPLFAYGYQVFDDIAGNKNGLVERGERVRLHVDVRDVGSGKAYKVWTTLRNLSGPGIFIHKGRFELGDLAPFPLASAPSPAALRAADFDFEVRPDFEPSDFSVELTVYDAILHDYMTEKLKFPIASAGDAQAPRAGVRWVTPPVLALDAVPLSTDKATAVLSGIATDDNRVSDLYILVANREAKIDMKKVFYVSHHGASDPKRLAFTAKVPLWPGQNHISVVARENDDVLSRQAIILTREIAPTTAARQ